MFILDFMRLSILTILFLCLCIFNIRPILCAQENHIMEENSTSIDSAHPSGNNTIYSIDPEAPSNTQNLFQSSEQSTKPFFYHLNNEKDHLLLKQINATPILSIEKLKVTRNLEIPFSITLIGLLIFSLIYYNNRGYVHHLFSAFRNPNLTQRQLEELIQQDSLINGLFNFMAMISLGIFAYVSLNYWHFTPQNGFIHQHLLIFLVLLFLSIYTLKVTLNLLIGYVFGIKKEMNTYIFQLLLTAKILGILLIPFSILIYFSEGTFLDTISYLSIFIVLLALILKFLRSGFLFKAFMRFSKFHFILYLCASEILPFLIALKLFKII